MLREPPIVMSRRFRKAHRKSSARLQGFIEGAVHDLVNRIRELPKTFKQEYGRLAQVDDVLEIDVTGGCRLLAAWDSGTLHLLDTGTHEVVPRYNRGKFLVDRLQRLEASPVFWPEGPDTELRFFTRHPCRSYSEYGPEQHREWLYWLSEQQADVVEEIVFEHADALMAGDLAPASLVVGGPGTGKTSVLVNLLKELRDLGIRARIVLSERLAKYFRACLPDVELDDVRANDPCHGADADVVLVDDPNNTGEIADWLQRFLDKEFQTVILGFDPCQLTTFDRDRKESGITDTDFTEICKIVNANALGLDVFGLDECYRQKENVGRAAKRAMDVVAESTPFLASSKIREFREKHQGLTELSNDLTFPNPHGYLEVYENAELHDLHREVDRILEKPLWRHWPPFLLVIDRAIGDRIGPWVEYMDDRRIEGEVVYTDKANDVKGLEFQHAFLLLGKDLYRQLETRFSGSGQAAYAQRRLIRIPFSRAKDSMVVFVV